MPHKKSLGLFFDIYISELLKKQKRTGARRGFTITEVLIALLVIAVIIVLILPVVTTRAQNKSFALSYQTEVKQMLGSLQALPVNENKGDITQTMMYVQDDESDDYTSTSGAYINKYMKVVKFCGNTPKGCFADDYYEYKDDERVSFDMGDKVGACALLKNGVSICLKPQIKKTSGRERITGWIDLNGPKAPNIYGRDLRTFSIDLNNKAIFTEEDPTNVILPDPPEPCVGEGCNPEPEDPCEYAPLSKPCCDKQQMTKDHICCIWYKEDPSHPNFAICNEIPPCPEDDPDCMVDACKNHVITGSTDECCAVLAANGENHPDCCSDTTYDDYCCNLKEHEYSAGCCLYKMGKNIAGFPKGSPQTRKCCEHNQVNISYPSLCGANVCEEDVNSEECCKTSDRMSEIEGPNDTCCAYTYVSNQVENCCKLPQSSSDVCCEWKYTNNSFSVDDACCKNSQHGLAKHSDLASKCCKAGYIYGEGVPKLDEICCKHLVGDDYTKLSSSSLRHCCKYSSYSNRPECCSTSDGLTCDEAGGGYSATCCMADAPNPHVNCCFDSSAAWTGNRLTKCCSYGDSTYGSNTANNQTKWQENCCSSGKNAYPSAQTYMSKCCTSESNWAGDCCTTKYDSSKNIVNDATWQSKCCTMDSYKTLSQCCLLSWSDGCCGNVKNHGESAWQTNCCGEGANNYPNKESFRNSCCTNGEVNSGGNSSDKKYCCDPNSTSPTKACCEAFQAASTDDKQWVDFDGNNLSKDYMKKCCAHGVCAQQCDIKWDAGQYDYSGCCASLAHEVGDSGAQYNTTATWKNGCCEFAGSATAGDKGKYASLNDYRSGCCDSNSDATFKSTNKGTNQTELNCCIPNSVKSIDSSTMAVTGGVQPAEACCKVFEKRGWKDYSGNSLNTMYKQVCCNEYDICPNDCSFLSTIPDSSRWNLPTCCSNSDMMAAHGNDAAWKSSCCGGKTGLSDNSFRQYCCSNAGTSETIYSGSQDKRCCTSSNGNTKLRNEYCCANIPSGKTDTTAINNYCTCATAATQWHIVLSSCCTNETVLERIQGTTTVNPHGTLGSVFDVIGVCPRAEAMDVTGQTLAAGGIGTVVPGGGTSAPVGQEVEGFGDTELRTDWKNKCCTNSTVSGSNDTTIRGLYASYCCPSLDTWNSGNVISKCCVDGVGNKYPNGQDGKCCSFLRNSESASDYCCNVFKNNGYKKNNGSVNNTFLSYCCQNGHNANWTGIYDEGFKNKCCEYAQSLNDSNSNKAQYIANYCPPADCATIYTNASDAGGVPANCCEELKSAHISESKWQNACCSSGTVSLTNNQIGYYCCADQYGNLKGGGTNNVCCTNYSHNGVCCAPGSNGYGNTVNPGISSASCCAYKTSYGWSDGRSAETLCCDRTVFTYELNDSERQIFRNGCCNYGLHETNTYDDNLRVDEISLGCCTWRYNKRKYGGGSSYFSENDPCCSDETFRNAHQSESQFQEWCGGEPEPETCEWSGHSGGNSATDACCAEMFSEGYIPNTSIGEDWRNGCCKKDSYKFTGNTYNDNYANCCQWRIDKGQLSRISEDYTSWTQEACCTGGKITDTETWQYWCCSPEYLNSVSGETQKDCCKRIYDAESSHYTFLNQTSCCQILEAEANGIGNDGNSYPGCITPCNNTSILNNNSLVLDYNATLAECCENRNGSVGNTYFGDICCRMKDYGGNSNQWRFRDKNKYYGPDATVYDCCEKRSTTKNSVSVYAYIPYYMTGTCNTGGIVNQCSSYKDDSKGWYCGNEDECMNWLNHNISPLNKEACCNQFYDAGNNSKKSDCCAIAKFKNNHRSYCCGDSPTTTNADYTCCSYWGTTAVGNNSSVKDACCAITNYNNDHSDFCNPCSGYNGAYGSIACTTKNGSNQLQCDLSGSNSSDTFYLYVDGSNKLTFPKGSSQSNKAISGITLSGSSSSHTVQIKRGNTVIASANNIDFCKGFTGSFSYNGCTLSSGSITQANESLCYVDPCATVSTSNANNTCCPTWDSNGQITNNDSIKTACCNNSSTYANNNKSYCCANSDFKVAHAGFCCGSTPSTALVDGFCCTYWHNYYKQIEQWGAAPPGTAEQFACCGNSDFFYYYKSTHQSYHFCCTFGGRDQGFAGCANPTPSPYNGTIKLRCSSPTSCSFYASGVSPSNLPNYLRGEYAVLYVGSNSYGQCSNSFSGFIPLGHSCGSAYPSPGSASTQDLCDPKPSNCGGGSYSLQACRIYNMNTGARVMCDAMITPSGSCECAIDSW